MVLRLYVNEDNMGGSIVTQVARIIKNPKVKFGSPKIKFNPKYFKKRVREMKRKSR
jgi:hypothetical protein